MSQFVHLHLHTQYSLLDGANKISAALERAHALGQPAIAMTDHGNLCGAIEFFTTAQKVGIKPLIGCEFYTTPTSRHDKRPRSQGGASTHHLTVIAMNNQGYQNLARLSTIAYREGFYFKPRIDFDVLSQYHEGLIITSGCMGGEFNSYIENDNIEAGRQYVEKMYKLLGDRFYFEVQPHPLPDQRKLNAGCLELATSMGIPIVATTDCHYLSKDDHFAQEVLMCISTQKQITDPDRLRHDGLTLHLKTAEEMYEELSYYSKVDEAIKASVEIAERCNVSFDFKTHYMPVFKTQEDRPLIDIMADLARAGLEQRFPTIEKNDPSFNKAKQQDYWQRLEFEINLIGKMGFAGYFLVVSDFIIWAKEHDIPVGPGRGSCAGSLVAYALRITELDPIQHKLLFERFLNPDRVSLPDIDVDFCIFGRDKVIGYVIEKYGKENVAQIATFGTLKAKAAIKDVGRALGIPYAETNKIAELIPAPRQGFDYPIAEALKMEPKLQEYANNEGKELITLAMKLEGLTRHASTHAAGVVIGDRPLIDLLPMMVDKDGKDVTQYSMTYVEKVGLVKFDFLGLKTLTVLKTACDLIEQSQGVTIDLNELPFVDQKVFSLLCSGNTTGIFQLESGGITEMTMRLRPSSFDDLVAILALYRPGPLDAGMVDHYIKRKHGQEKVAYLHPLMQETLADTYGIILYQEQIMQLARVLAGYSLAEADILRKAMGKKNPEEMAKQRTFFLKGTAAKQIPDKLANEIFDQMETFARYGFNRSHSAAYALVSYQTAYLKAHYPVEFMAALMNHEMDDSDKILKNLNECRKSKIHVLPPDVNESIAGFSVAGDKIRYGLEAVKSIGERSVEAVIEARRDGGVFQSIDDFMSRVDLTALNKKVVENFIKCGAFDSFGESRRELFESLELLFRNAQAKIKQEQSNQLSLFGGGTTVDETLVRKPRHLPEWPVNHKLAYEREALGFYISGHPLEKFRAELKKFGAISTIEVKGQGSKPVVKVGGVVTALKLKNTKKGDRYASFVFEDSHGTIETLVWPDTYRKFSSLIAADEPILITGKSEVNEEKAQLVVEKIESLISLRDKSASVGILQLTASDQFELRASRLMNILERHVGKCPIKVAYESGGSKVNIDLKDAREAPVCVEPSELLCEAVEQVFGRPVLTFV
jgi:DNA polymerase-3 subunit alpha